LRRVKKDSRYGVKKSVRYARSKKEQAELFSACWSCGCHYACDEVYVQARSKACESPGQHSKDDAYHLLMSSSAIPSSMLAADMMYTVRSFMLQKQVLLFLTVTAGFPQDVRSSRRLSVRNCLTSTSHLSCTPIMLINACQGLLSMPKRLQSASSINCFKQCPRKYYYQYIECLPSKPRPELVRGNVVHEVLEHFFDLDPAGLGNHWRSAMQSRLAQLFVKHWHAADDQWKTMGLSPVELARLKEESVVMLMNWLNHLVSRMDSHPVAERFRQLVPMREHHIESKTHNVHGFIDAIETVDNITSITDYKTSKSAHLSPEYKLQMAVYLLLFKEHFQKLPDKANFFFLRHGPLDVPVDDALVDHARLEVAFVHEQTVDAASKDEYGMQPGPLCSYCDFCGTCFRK